MNATSLRRLGTVAGGAALAAGLLAGLAGPASAAPGDLTPTPDRVIQPVNTKNLLQPTGNTVGARIVSKPRIGQANETPESQVWTFDHPKVIDANGNQVRGALSFVFQPSLKSGRPLCIDVVGDSQSAGAALELRPCDGTPSQAWVPVGDLRVPFVQNVHSRLNMEVQLNGSVVQQPFVGRIPSNLPLAEQQALRARNQAQTFLLSPKSFGVGGA